MRSVMQHQFSKVPQAQIQRSSFDRSHGHKTTFDAGYLVPIFVDEALPGDTFNLNMTAFARLATPIKPVMDNMYLETFFFAVPLRLLWDNFQAFMGELEVPNTTVDYEVPKIAQQAGQGTSGSIYDYMGIPIYAAGTVNFAAFHLRAYNLIWNEWFRDQNLQEKVTEYTGDGPDPYNGFELLRRGKRHDYFTSCLPWPQKGQDVTIPTLGTAPVEPTFPGSEPSFKSSVQSDNSLRMSSGTSSVQWENTPVAGIYNAQWDNPNLVADLSEASVTSINDLRIAFQLQKMLERDARGGTRYTEVIQAHFGVTSPDARLQRPEFLGGGSSRVIVKPVEQTTPETTVGSTPQGNLAAMGTAQLNGHGFTKSFTEHCVVIGMINARADLTYQQGLHRMWFRNIRYDYYWPAFAHLGEQQVYAAEIFTDTVPANPGVLAEPKAAGEIPVAQPPYFGYQERYAEYRYKPSQITGKFRSQDPDSLDVWHLSQEFANEPVLNAEFIEDNPPVDRVIATQGEPHFLFDSYFSFKCARPMPLYGVPGNIDRF